MNPSQTDRNSQAGSSGMPLELNSGNLSQYFFKASAEPPASPFAGYCWIWFVGASVPAWFHGGFIVRPIKKKEKKKENMYHVGSTISGFGSQMCLPCSTG